MKWIGLTGGLATGKSTVAAILRKNGFQVIDADELARQAVQAGSPGLKYVVQTFGPTLLTAEGELDRRALGKIVFGKPDQLARLEAIIHPIVRQLGDQAREKARAAGEKLAFYDVPLLFEKKCSRYSTKL